MLIRDRAFCIGRRFVLAGFACAALTNPVRAQNDVYVSNVLPTPSLYGGVGLLEMRNARFMPDGYLWITATVKQPDNRIAINWQALPWMEATFRYAINYALAPIGQRALYDRSFDVKLRLFQEGKYTPQIALGLQDFIGTGVYSAEYLVASKQFGSFDLTAGMGWGRLGSRGTITNPFCKIATSFCTRAGSTDTSTTGGTPSFGDWFHGPDVGIFGGVEYQTPIPDLTFKIEYSTDDYEAESSFNTPHIRNPSVHPQNYAPMPVNAGFDYRVWNDVGLGVAIIGGRELSVNASIAMDPTEPNWPFRLDPQPPFVARPSGAGQPMTQLNLGESSAQSAWPVHFFDLTMPSKSDMRPPDPSAFHGDDWHIADVFHNAGLHLTDGWIAGDTLVAQVDLSGPSGSPCPTLESAGHLPTPKVVLLSSNWDPIGTCSVTTVAAQPEARPPVSGWQPGILAAMREAVEGQQLVVEGISIAHGVVTVEIENDRYLRDAEAISRTARALSGTAPADIAAFEITTTMSHVPLATVTFSRAELDAAAQGDTTPAELWSATILSDASPNTHYHNGPGDPQFTWSLFPSLQEDLFDPDNPTYIGVGISGKTRTELFPGLVLDDEATWSVWNNFGSITRPNDSLLPHVRTDIVTYLQKGSTGINLLTLSDYFKPAPDVYTRLTAGYIEQMFAGVGGEILYRPFGQRWAVGADIYDVYQRNFDDLFGLHFGGQSYHVVTGHASLYIETPWENIVSVVRAGRYLAGDYGGTLELYRRFDTGIIIGAWATFTNVPFSKFGEGSFDKGIRIVIPLEWALPIGTTALFEEDLRPVQRDGGQPLYNDAQLYDMTQSSSYGDLERQWPHVFQ
ncbi:MAG TPA: YjbH domain-containing protein [Rhizomicrobium sp.]|nr:YjbH domain-containing protein [Rhizomicrobium sp.]